MEHVVRELVKVPGVAICCHPHTQSLLLRLEGPSHGQDVYCICGSCGTESDGEYWNGGFSAWVSWAAGPLSTMELLGPSFPVVNAWRTPHSSKKRPTSIVKRDPPPVRVAIVPDSHAHPQDSVARHVPTGHYCDIGGAPGRIQLQRAAKPQRRIVVDAKDSTDPHPNPDSDTARGSGSGNVSGNGIGSQHDSDKSGTNSDVTRVEQVAILQ